MLAHKKPYSKEYVLNYIQQKNTFLTLKEISNDLGMTQSTLYYRLQDLIQDKKVVIYPERNKSNLKRYGLKKFLTHYNNQKEQIKNEIIHENSELDISEFFNKDFLSSILTTNIKEQKKEEEYEKLIKNLIDERNTMLKNIENYKNELESKPKEKKHVLNSSDLSVLRTYHQILISKVDSFLDNSPKDIALYKKKYKKEFEEDLKNLIGFFIKTF
jgi:hypothetical protein